MGTQIICSILGVVVGLFLITLLVEPLEFAAVTLINGGVASDPEDYFAIRNRGWFLGAKFVYTTGAGVAGGFAAALLAGRAPLVHAGAVGALQTLGFAYALATPEMRETAPLWMWIGLIPITLAGIMLGGRLAARRRAARQGAPRDSRSGAEARA